MGRVMRVALVSQEYPPETAHGGIATQTRAKAVGLAALGHAVHVVSHSVDGRRHVANVDGIAVIRIPGFDALMPLHTEIARSLTWSALVAAEVAQLNDRVGLDVVDFPDWGNEAHVHLLNRTPWSRLPTVIHLHGPLSMLAERIGWPEPGSDLQRIGTAIEGDCLRRADAIVSSSRCSADWVARRHGIDRGGMPIIHTGIDTARFRPGLAPPDNRPTIVCSGRVARSKGVDTLVDAACRLAAEWPLLRLRLIGNDADAPLVNNLRSRTAAAGCPDLLDIVGHVAHGALPQLLCRALVHAAPSPFEAGPGLANLEAMACGLPVIACSGSGSSEVIADGASGLLVPPGDAAALSAALRRLLADAALRARLGSAARAAVEADHGSTDCVRRYAAFLASVVEAAP